MANKKLTDVTQASSFALTDNMFINQGNSAKQVKGQVVNDAIVANAVTKAKTDMMPVAADGVFIMYHTKSDNSPLASRPESWTALQNSGEIADGVLVVQGGKHIVVAPTDSGVDMKWSSSAVLVGSPITDRIALLNDFDGKSKTAAILSDATIGSDGDGYAAGFCASYSRVNANGQGLTAGKWWLPSVGELFMIFSNYNKINYCLTLISGSSQLYRANTHWSSTENSISAAWHLAMGNSAFSTNNKESVSRRVRPVSAFIV